MKVKSGRPWLGYYQPAATLGGSTTLSISALTRHPNPPFNTFPGYLRLNMHQEKPCQLARDSTEQN